MEYPPLTLQNCYNPLLAISKKRISKKKRDGLNYSYYTHLTRSVLACIRFGDHDFYHNIITLLDEMRLFFIYGLKGDKKLFKHFILNRGVYKGSTIWILKKNYIEKDKLPEWAHPLVFRVIIGPMGDLTHKVCDGIPKSVFKNKRANWEDVFNVWFIKKPESKFCSKDDEKRPFGAMAAFDKIRSNIDKYLLWKNIKIDNEYYYRVKDVLIKRFSEAQNVDISNIGLSKPENPFREILFGDVMEETFLDAIDCCEDTKFIEEWSEKRKKLQKIDPNKTTLFPKTEKREEIIADERKYRRGRPPKSEIEERLEKERNTFILESEKIHDEWMEIDNPKIIKKIGASGI